MPGASLGLTEFVFAWSPDGRHFAYLATEDPIMDLKAVFVAPADASSRRRIADATGSISWSPRP